MDMTTMIRQIQKQKVIGELNALKLSYYDPMGSDRDLYYKVSSTINEIINRLNEEIAL